ncbi:MAG: hypothetical protein AB7V00_05425, partial [Bacilli bacterium]
SFINAKGETITPASGSATYYAADSTRISVKGTNVSPVIYELPVSASNTELDAFLGDITNADGAIDYFIAKTGHAPIGATTVSVPATASSAAELDDVALVTLNTLEGSYNVGTITIRIWIEGWDPDCFNSVLGDAITVGLVFEARVS